MFKKRLKGLLAMALAGSMALAALPLTASATINSNIDYGDRNFSPTAILDDGGFAADCPLYNSSYLTENNLWAISTKEGTTYNAEYVTGNNLHAKLKALKDSTTTYEKVDIRSDHDYLITTKSGSLTYVSTDDENNNSLLKSVSVFPAEIDVSSYYNPSLQKLESWTAWYGVLCGKVAIGLQRGGS